MRFFTFLTGALLGIASLMGNGVAYAQAPTNDRCSTARAVPSGQTVVADTRNANDDIVGLAGCQAGAPGTIHPDVWYYVTASGSRLDYAIQPDPSSASVPYEIIVFEGTCNGALIIVGTTCATGNRTGTVGGLIAGQRYSVVVSSPDPAQTGQFFLTLTSSVPTVTPAQDCDSARILSTGAPIIQGPLNLGAGSDPDEVDPMNSCWGSGGERQPKWYKFVAGATGRLQFNINPVDPNTDYDWAVWDITSDPFGCTTKGDAIACNWTGARGATGLSLCPSSEPGYQGGDQFDNKTTNQTGANGPITVQAGRIYALLVDNFTVNSTGFTLSFGGPPGGCPGSPPNPLTRIGLDAQFNYTKIECDSVRFVKRNPIAQGVNVSYLWNFGDGAVSRLASPSHRYNFQVDSTITVTLRVVDTLGNAYVYGQPVRIAPPDVQVSRSAPGEICQGESITLTASGADTLTWTGPGLAQPVVGRSITVRPDTTTVYQVRGVREQCEAIEPVEVRVTLPQVSAGVIDRPEGVPPHTTTFHSTTPGANGWLWTFGDGTTSTDSIPSHTYQNAGTYDVLLAVTYGNGCQAEAQRIGTVTVRLEQAPNIITPNGDGKNDVFKALVSSRALHLEVFNRWGRKVFDKQDYRQDWGGDDLAAGTYYYHLTDAAGQSWKGWIEIVR